MYLTGYPNFYVEKPLLAIYNQDNLQKLQTSREWYGELKLKVRRGLITIDYKNEIKFYKYLTDIPVKHLELPISRIHNMDLPPKTILDAGLYIDSVDQLPRFFIFDILLYRANELLTNCLQRRKLLETLIKTDDTIWRPHYTDFWLQEFRQMLEGDSFLIKKSALNFGIPYERFIHEVEGLVIKNKKSRLKYPKKQTIFSHSFFKLKIDMYKNKI